MGTDITYFAERRRGLQGWEPCYEPQSQAAANSPRFFWFYCGEDRNYALFAILAGIQRLTNSGFESISPPRGLPPDLSTAIRALAAHTLTGDEGYHSHSWLSLRELLDFPWHQRKRRYRGLVDADNYRLFREQGRPRSLRRLGEVSGCGCPPPAPPAEDEVLSNEEMQRYIEGGGLEVEAQFRHIYTPVLLPAPKPKNGGKLLKRYLDAREYAYYKQHGRARWSISEFHFREHLQLQGAGAEYVDSIWVAITNEEMDQRLQRWGPSRAPQTEVAFEVPYGEYCRAFVDESLPRLRTLGEPDDVRIVFWFD